MQPTSAASSTRLTLHALASTVNQTRTIVRRLLASIITTSADAIIVFEATSILRPIQELLDTSEDFLQACVSCQVPFVDTGRLARQIGLCGPEYSGLEARIRQIEFNNEQGTYSVLQQLQELGYIEAALNRANEILKTITIEIRANSKSLQMVRSPRNLRNLSIELGEAVSDAYQTRMLDESLGGMLLGRLLAKPRYLRDTCDVWLGAAGPFELVYSLDPYTHHEAWLPKYGRTSWMSCGCKPCTDYQPRKELQWGTFLSMYTKQTFHHEPDCTFSQKNLPTTSRFRVPPTLEIMIIISSAVEITFTSTRGPGGRSINPRIAFQMRRPRSSSPVFQVFDLIFQVLESIDDSIEHRRGMQLADRMASEFTTFLRLCFRGIISSFHQGLASPFDTDTEGWSVLHDLAAVFYRIIHLLPNQLPVLYTEFQTYTGLGHLGGMTDDHGNTALMQMGHDSVIMLPLVEQLILGGAEALGRQRLVRPSYDNLEFFRNSSIASEAYQCGHLSIALFQGTNHEVEDILMDGPCSIFHEVNLLGQTPIHLACHRPSILRNLLDWQPLVLFIDQADLTHEYPINYALRLSGTLCNMGNLTSLCVDCNCSESVEILLEADCSLYSSNLSSALFPASQKSRQLFLLHLKDRRVRLKQLALEALAPDVLEELDLSRCPDYDIDKLIKRLWETGFEVPLALSGQHNRSPHDGTCLLEGSLYHSLDHPATAAFAYEIGFNDITISNYLGLDALTAHSLGPYPNFHYIAWLVDHGLDISTCVVPKNPEQITETTAVMMAKLNIEATRSHYIAAAWGRRVDFQSLDDMPQTVANGVLNSEISDDCLCGCGEKGCSPFMMALKGTCSKWDTSKSLVTSAISLVLSVKAAFRGLKDDLRIFTETIRYLTFCTLDLTHTCCRPTEGKPIAHTFTTDEVHEIRKREMEGLHLCEALVHEFDKNFAEKYSSSDSLDEFITGVWSARMRSVLGSAKLSESDKVNSEDIGVVSHTISELDDDGRSVSESSFGMQVWFDRLHNIIPRSAIGLDTKTVQPRNQLVKPLDDKPSDSGYHSLSSHLARTSTEPGRPESMCPVPFSDDDLKACLTQRDSSKIKILLHQHFSEVAVGEYSWLLELKALGLSSEDIAEILVEKLLYAPWIFGPFHKPHYFPVGEDPQNTTKNGGNSNRTALEARVCQQQHIDEPCQHVDDTGVEYSVREAIDFLCGIGGIRPRADGLPIVEFGTAEFKENNSVALISLSKEDGLSVLRTLLEDLEAATNILQRVGGCLNSLTFLTLADDSVELQNTELRIIQDLRRILEQSNDLTWNVDLFGIVWEVFSCAKLQRKLGQRANYEASDDLFGSLCALAVQFLALALLSYSQAHCGPFRPSFLDSPVERVVLTGWQGGPCIVCSMVELTCFGEMLRRPVLAFESAIRQSDTLLVRETRIGLDLIASPDDVLDTWGPGELLTDKSRPGKLFAIIVGGGIIISSGNSGTAPLLHWARKPKVLRPVPASFDRFSKARIGGVVIKNGLCKADPAAKLRNAVSLLAELGTSPSYWEVSERQAGLGAQGGQIGIAALQFNQTWIKMRGSTKKSKMLAQRSVFITDLESLFGVQVSVCTSIARRVRLRDLLADLLPTYVENLVTKPKLWDSLIGQHALIPTMRGDTESLRSWLEHLDHDHQAEFEGLVMAILFLLQDTGINWKCQNFVVACVQPELAFQCFKIPCLKENYWTRMLVDSEETATFAYVTSDCLEDDSFKCHGSSGCWVNSTSLFCTAVSCWQGTPVASSLTPRLNPAPWTLKHSEAYLIGKPDAPLFVQVDRPDDQDAPRLLASISKIQADILRRLYRKGFPGKPRRLRESRVFDQIAETVTVLVSQKT